MKLFRIAAIAAALMLPNCAFAQFPNQHPDPSVAMPAQGGPVAIGQAMAQKDDSGKVAIVMAPAPPAEATTSFSIGTWIADLLGGLTAIFGSVIATFITKWVMAVAKKAGVDASQAMSDRLDQIIENGLHAGATDLGRDLKGKLNVQVKNQVISDAVSYAQNHGAETVKSISGLDINDPKTVEALQARAAKVLSTIGPETVLATASVTAQAPAAAEAPADAAPVTLMAGNGHPPTTAVQE